MDINSKINYSQVSDSREKEFDWYNKEINKERRKWRLSVIILTIFVFFLSLSSVWGVYLVSQRTRMKSRAYESSSRKVELSNSYLFASPLKARVGGERIRITVFILDGQGLGVSGKRVSLNNNHVQIEDIQNVTDDLGKAIFDVYSSASGTFQIEAFVDGRVIPQKALVTFE